MKNKQTVMIVTMVLMAMFITPMAIAENIDPDNSGAQYAYAENAGWTNWEPNAGGGVHVYNDRIKGYIWGENIGWINVSPVSYGGVGNDGNGNLSGYAWGANVGWINLSTLATLTLAAPDSDNDGIPDAWEFGHTNTLLVLSASPTDSDGDGIPDLGEYAADTDPFGAGDYLAITDFQTLETTNIVTWTCEPTRLYTLQYAAALSNGMAWTGTGSSFIPPWSGEIGEMVIGVTDTNRFYRVQAEPPLAP